MTPLTKSIKKNEKNGLIKPNKKITYFGCHENAIML